MTTVLIVDDDPAFRAALGEGLQKSGYRVMAAVDGDEAMRILDEHHAEISVVIVDLVLPGTTDGFQVIGAIARRETVMKVIATTARLRDRFLETCKYLGAHAVIRKPRPEEPFPLEEWLSTIETVLAAESDLHRASGGGQT